jgi:transcriptional regulator with XRE-family HTH domain
MHVGERIKPLREQAGLSLRGLAAFLSQIEAEKFRPPKTCWLRWRRLSLLS